MYLLLAHCVAAAGGLLAKLRKVPAGAMLGAMGAAAVLGMFMGDIVYPSNLRTAVQICSGIIIGCRFSRSDLIELRKIAKPACILIVMLLVWDTIFALLMARFTSVDLMTALFSCAPGGVTDLALIAVDFGANTETVTLLQLCRFVFVLLFFPPFLKHRHLKGAPRPAQADTAADLPQSESQPLPLKTQWLRTLFSLCAGTAGGLLLRVLGMPAGAIVGAIIATTLANVTTQKIFLFGWLKTVVQICAGCYVGSQVTLHTVLSAGTLLVPMLIVVACALVMAFATSWIIRRISKMELSTSLFSCIPGGIAEMGLIAEEMGLDTPKIVVMHTCRVILTICVMPVLVKIFALI